MTLHPDLELILDWLEPPNYIANLASVEVARKAQAAQSNSPSDLEILKWTNHHQLQEFLKTKKLKQALALVEGLAIRLPDDPDVRSWQARAYVEWGRQLFYEGRLDLARIYLKKALKADPHNRVMWAEVEKCFQEIEQKSLTLKYGSPPRISKAVYLKLVVKSVEFWENY